MAPLSVDPRLPRPVTEFQNVGIQDWYAGKRIFITGGTGFVGKILVEKILRSCPDVGQVYLLMRNKSGKDSAKRFEEYTSAICFHPLKESNPAAFKKLRMIKGDILEEELGICNDDRAFLMENIDVVIHCAATVKFNLPLKQAVQYNVVATLKMLELSKQMKNLVSFLHVSTAYSQKIGEVLEERPYEMQHDPLRIVNLVNVLDDKMIEKITPMLLEGYSNTYTFTKAMAESLLQKYQHKLPIAVARPAIVLCCINEPVRGFTEYMHGPNGLSHAGAHGFIRVMLCDGSVKIGYVPVDHVANACIAIARERGLQPGSSPTVDPLPFYNVIENEDGVTWDETLKYGIQHSRWSSPYSRLMWFPTGFNESSLVLWYFYSFFIHTIPSLLIDFVAILSGKKPFAMKVLKIVNKGILEYRVFALKEWRFKNANLRQVFNNLSDKDKKLFNFDVWNIDWDDYMKTYVYGLRTFIAKDPPETIPKAQRLSKILCVVHYTFLTLFYGCMFMLLWKYFGRYLQ